MSRKKRRRWINFHKEGEKEEEEEELVGKTNTSRQHTLVFFVALVFVSSVIVTMSVLKSVICTSK